MEPAAILIARKGTNGPLLELVDRLMSVGVAVTIVDEVAVAVDISANYGSPPCFLIDLTTVGTELEDQRVATDAIRRVIDVVPVALPVPVLNEGDAGMVLACIRAGAGDVIDLQVEGTVAMRGAVQRICAKQATRVSEVTMIQTQRSMIEDLLRDLIRTERRSIDAEDQLARQRRVTGEHAAVVETRAPAILLVEHDREVADELADLLEAAGVATFAYVTGEEAVREAETLAGSTGLDLALVAAQLPGIDGLETVRRLRDRVRGLPAFLMTSVIDASLASNAANLGVVGFVQKPLDDLDTVVARLAQLAQESLERTREQAYLARIKERHERVLARYRSLPREA